MIIYSYYVVWLILIYQRCRMRFRKKKPRMLTRYSIRFPKLFRLVIERAP